MLINPMIQLINRTKYIIVKTSRKLLYQAHTLTLCEKMIKILNLKLVDMF